MYRRISDFRDDFAEESGHTARLLQGLTRDALAVRPASGVRSLGEIAWHLPQSLKSIAQHCDLDVEAPEKGSHVPSDPAEIVAAYERAATSLLSSLDDTEHDESWLEGTCPIYSLEWTRGRILRVLLAHEIHHRGQLTALYRLAGLNLPAIYGPSADDSGFASA